MSIEELSVQNAAQRQAPQGASARARAPRKPRVKHGAPDSTERNRYNKARNLRRKEARLDKKRAALVPAAQKQIVHERTLKALWRMKARRLVLN